MGFRLLGKVVWRLKSPFALFYQIIARRTLLHDIGIFSLIFKIPLRYTYIQTRTALEKNAWGHLRIFSTAKFWAKFSTAKSKILKFFTFHNMHERIVRIKNVSINNNKIHSRKFSTSHNSKIASIPQKKIEQIFLFVLCLQFTVMEFLNLDLAF